MAAPTLHSDACIEDVRRFGFCEHDRLPLRPTPPPRRRFKERHPWRFELFATAACIAIVYGNVQIINYLGFWHGTLVVLATGLGYLLLVILGPPAWFTLDPSRIIPPGLRHDDPPPR